MLTAGGSSPVAQRVKDQVWSLQLLRLLLWRGFDPWPGNFHLLWAPPFPKENDMTDEYLRFDYKTISCKLLEETFPK